FILLCAPGVDGISNSPQTARRQRGFAASKIRPGLEGSLLGFARDRCQEAPMGWGEVIKGFLKALTELIRDVPSWAKVVISFAIVGVFSFLLVVNARPIFVYDIQIDEVGGAGAGGTPESRASYRVSHAGGEASSDLDGYVKVVVQTDPFQAQQN